ncbi:hypothetical protein ASPBRDRAFT_440083 [Aspergillus brasiliensis CBS 101740]|uniref:Uncharacterized protein n=1 Tax=Aspergillus brasiliensis (strain CBS 101740 / IMI 381727 / IBT 21946) TaxID=767769 RepID=A0A1L9URH1_ASPBC|nr:hypothetical protein ASPBRDRAFT_440083 [Aspergillus brasiliensis CBS 101740]
MATASSNPSSVLKRAVLVSINTQEVLPFSRLRLAHDSNTNKGSISLEFEANITNLGSKSKMVLNIPPESVQDCTLAKPSNVRLFKNDWIKLLPAPVSSILNVITLSLTLGTPGTVRCQSGMESLCPAVAQDSDFSIFAKICKSRYLNIHFSTRQFKKSELDQLEDFSSALQEKCVQQEPLNYARHGIVEGDWRALGLFREPPPYSEERIFNQGQQTGPPLCHEGSSSTQVARKRYRDRRSIPFDKSDSDERQKRLMLDAVLSRRHSDILPYQRLQ